LLNVAAAVGDIDTAMSVAVWREGTREWTRPRFRPEGSLTVSDLRHPLIDDAVPNSITLEQGAGVLITGANMSGKSTFLRTVGVNAILAQALNTCLAREYTGPVLEVRSCIGRSDDLMSGKSYYLVEVEALLGLVRSSESDRPHLFLLDELFRGTNAVERVAAGHAVLQELLETASGLKPHVAIVATHDGELVALLPALYGPYHFGDSVDSDGLMFDYRLKPGPATTRTAIALLRQCGAPERLLDRATNTAGMLDRQRDLNGRSH
jgi:DNA mismatch repair ATPase MutS